MNWDVLVLDNARYHDGGENKYLTDWLWDDFRILLLFLPTRTPKWNPVENVWAMLAKLLRIFPLSPIRNVQADVAAYAVHHILNHKRCQYFHNNRRLVLLRISSVPPRRVVVRCYAGWGLCGRS